MTSFDEIAGDLQALRVAAGSPSYAEIALRITRLREERGEPEAQARPARTTVYDAFRTGRRRLDTALVLDIVRALGAEEADVEHWAGRCRAAHSTEPPAAPAPSQTEAAGLAEVAPVAHPGVRAILLLCLGCLLVNLVGRTLIDFVQLPLYLDMIGTAVAAVVAGPWWGAGVGLATNLLGVPVSGWDSAPFALVNVAGALVWGYGVRRWRMGATIPRYAALNCIAAVTCSLIAVPIIIALDGVTGHGADDVTATILEAVGMLWLAVASSNILTSLADKVLCGFVALLAVDVLPRDLVDRVRPLMPLSAAAPLRSEA